MFHRLQIVPVLFLSLFLFGCSFMPDELKRAESLIESSPDSALYILQHISPDKFRSDESRALYGLLMVEALDRKPSDVSCDSLLAYSLQYYTNHHQAERLAACYLYKGRLYKRKFQYENATNNYLKALDYLEGSKDYLLLGKVHSDIADIYLYQTEYKRATQKYNVAYGCFAKARNANSANYCLINIGKCYSQSRKYKEAHRYFFKVYATAKDSLVKGFAVQYIGVNYYSARMYDSALVYLRKAVRYPYFRSNMALRYYYLADLYFDCNRFDSAFYCATKSFDYETDIRIKRECYRILVNTANNKGDIPGLKKYMALYQDCSDSIRKIDAQTKGSVIETIHATRQESEKKQNRLWYLGIALLVVIILSALLYMSKHRKSEQTLHLREENHQMQRAGIRKEVMLKHRDALLRKIEDHKASHTPEWKKAGPAERERIDRKMYEELLHLNDITFFYKEMDTVLNNMVTKLQTRYQLNEKEIQWCCLYLLNVSNQDIMMLLDYTQDALKKMRQRLANNKFGIKSLRELEPFLYGILTE